MTELLQRAPAAAEAAPISPEARRVLLDQLHNDSRSAARQIRDILQSNTYLGSHNQADIMAIVHHWAEIPAAPNSHMTGMDWLIAGLTQNTYEVGTLVKQLTSAFDELHRRMSSENAAEFQRLVSENGQQFKNSKPTELAKFEVTQEDIIRGIKAGGELAAAVATGGGSMILQVVSWLANTLPGLWDQIKAVFNLVDAIKAFKASGIGSKFNPGAIGALAVSALFGEMQGLPVLGGAEPPKADDSSHEASGLTKVLMSIVHGITVVKSAYNKVATRVNGILGSFNISEAGWLKKAAMVYAGIATTLEKISDPGKALGELAEGVKSAVGGFFTRIKEHIGEIVGDIKGKLELLLDPAQLLHNVADRLVSTVLNFIITHPPSELLRTVFSVIQTAAGKDLIDLVREQLKPAGDAIIGKIANSSVVQGALSPLKGPVHKIADGIGAITNKGLAVVHQVEDKVASFLAPERLRELAGLGETAAAPVAVAAAAAEPSGFLEVVKRGLHSHLLSIGMSHLKAAGKQLATKAWEKTKSAAKAAYAGIKGAIFGQKAHFKGHDEGHDVWTEQQEGGARSIMVASEPAPLAFRLTGYRDSIKAMTGKGREQAESILADVTNLMTAINAPDLKPNGATKLMTRLASKLENLEGVVAASGAAPQRANIAYAVDGQGRPVMARGGPLRYVSEGRRQRNGGAQQAVLEPLKEIALPTNKKTHGDLAYEASHLITNSLGGSGEAENLVPMTRLTNQSWSKTFENFLSDQPGGFYAEVRVEYPATLPGPKRYADVLKKVPDRMTYRIWKLVNEAEVPITSASFETENRGNMLRASQVDAAVDPTGVAPFVSASLPRDAPEAVMRWGRSSEQAANRLNTLERLVAVKGAPAAAKQLTREGITPDIAGQWVDFYSNEVRKQAPSFPEELRERAKERLRVATRTKQIVG